jgi:hypothetical protein
VTISCAESSCGESTAGRLAARGKREGDLLFIFNKAVCWLLGRWPKSQDDNARDALPFAEGEFALTCVGDVMAVAAVAVAARLRQVQQRANEMGEFPLDAVAGPVGILSPDCFAR